MAVMLEKIDKKLGFTSIICSTDVLEYVQKGKGQKFYQFFTDEIKTVLVEARRRASFEISLIDKMASRAILLILVAIALPKLVLLVLGSECLDTLDEALDNRIDNKTNQVIKNC